MQKVTTFLMFEGTAEAAIELYRSVFDDAEVVSLVRYGAGGPGAEGAVERADLRLGNLELMLFNSPGRHAFTFAPAVSLFVTCDDDAELERLVAGLGGRGEFLMARADYGFSRRFACLNERFGVSWQLKVPA